MLEQILFGKLALPGELVRIVVAILGTAVASYYDVFNKKNVPDRLLYAFLGIAFLVNLFFFEENLFWFSVALAAIVGGIGYIFYRVGQLGGADVFVLVALILLLPIHPSFLNLPFNFPFIFSLLIFSGVVFSIYALLYFGWKLYKLEAKPKLAYALLLIPYGVFAYLYVNSFIFSPLYFVFISILLLSSFFFLMFRDSLTRALSEELPVSQLEPEDVVAIELMNKDLMSKYKIPRVLKESDIKNLQDAKVGEVWVYTKLLPFLPFVLIGLVLSMVFARGLILI
ncbi:hypothetical protein HY990_03460 [Candidatus Micrarchaeota archaeon]|nr:hypothetical protein [Candidatus Micrarchaeota archaeon]